MVSKVCMRGSKSPPYVLERCTKVSSRHGQTSHSSSLLVIGWSVPSVIDRLPSEVCTYMICTVAIEMRCRKFSIRIQPFFACLTIRLISFCLYSWLLALGFQSFAIFSFSRNSEETADMHIRVHQCPLLGCRDRPKVIPSRLAECNIPCVPRAYGFDADWSVRFVNVNRDLLFLCIGVRCRPLLMLNCERLFQLSFGLRVKN